MVVRAARSGSAPPATAVAVSMRGDEARVGYAETHLRAVTALLVSLSTYQDVVRARQPSSGRCDARTPRSPTINGHASGAHTNGVDADNTAHVPADRPEHSTSAAREPERVPPRDLAATAARYIARDLAARQLTEFTSAEGYRLARALARIGGVDEAVETVLRQANTIRLHPAPLADAVSHSPH